MAHNLSPETAQAIYAECERRRALDPRQYMYQIEYDVSDMFGYSVAVVNQVRMKKHPALKREPTKQRAANGKPGLVAHCREMLTEYEACKKRIAAIELAAKTFGLDLYTGKLTINVRSESLTKRIQLVHANPLPRGQHACDLCLFNRKPTECAKPEYDDCVTASNSYYAEVDDAPVPTE